jgi:hypothetical protein
MVNMYTQVDKDETSTTPWSFRGGVPDAHRKKRTLIALLGAAIPYLAVTARYQEHLRVA